MSVSKIKNYFWKSLKIPSNAVSQEEFFAAQIDAIRDSTHIIRFLGYDQAFFENEGTIHELEKALNGEGEGRASFPISITALLPEAVKGGRIEYLTNEYPSFEIIKTNKNLENGFSVYDEFAVGIWDSTKETVYESEKGNGICLRYLVEDVKIARQFITVFENDIKLLKKIEV